MRLLRLVWAHLLEIVVAVGRWRQEMRLVVIICTRFQKAAGTISALNETLVVAKR